MPSPSVLTPRSFGVGTKLAAITFALVAVALGGFIWVVATWTSVLLEKQAMSELRVSTQGVVDLVETFDKDLRREAGRSERLLEGYYPEPLTVEPGTSVVVAGTSTPVLKSGDRTVNLDTAVVDRFTAKSGLSATVFVKSGEDFVRVATSMKKENGERAVGTKLDHNHPAYAELSLGRPFNGVANLFGKKYATQYTPIPDGRGAVIGAFYVGVDFTTEAKVLEGKIASVVVGKTGSFFVLDAKRGPDYGKLVIDKERAGTMALDWRDRDGHTFIRDMLEREQGELRYRTAATKEDPGRSRIATFAKYKGWSWVIVANTDAAEVTEGARTLTRTIAISGGGVLFVLAVLVYLVVRWMISQPLAVASSAAERLARGDLTARLRTTRSDEIGRLLESIDGIGRGLVEVVSTVRTGTRQVVASTGEITVGNDELGSRTAQQTEAVERTATTMGELMGTVNQNAEHAKKAEAATTMAAREAEQGGEMMHDAVATMAAIDDSARKIQGILGVIDAIALQIKILALNAAVEAARAGAQGRGFAVVANEIRTLAQHTAEAAREVHSLIDGSADRIGEGTKEIARAGVAISSVVTTLKDLASIMARMNHASNEQREAIAQANGAVSEIARTTRQNDQLVAEASAAASDLHEQAGALSAAVAVFRIDGDVDGFELEPALADMAVGPHERPGDREAMVA